MRTLKEELGDYPFEYHEDFIFEAPNIKCVFRSLRWTLEFGIPVLQEREKVLKRFDLAKPELAHVSNVLNMFYKFEAMLKYELSKMERDEGSIVSILESRESDKSKTQ